MISHSPEFLKVTDLGIECWCVVVCIIVECYDVGDEGVGYVGSREVVGV